MKQLATPDALDQIMFALFLVSLLSVGYTHAILWFLRPSPKLLREHPLAWTLLYGICTLIAFGYYVISRNLLTETLFMPPIKLIYIALKYVSLFVASLFFGATLFATALTFKKRSHRSDVNTH